MENIYMDNGGRHTAVLCGIIVEISSDTAGTSSAVCISAALTHLLPGVWRNQSCLFAAPIPIVGVLSGASGSIVYRIGRSRVLYWSNHYTDSEQWKAVLLCPCLVLLCGTWNHRSEFYSQESAADRFSLRLYAGSDSILDIILL